MFKITLYDFNCNPICDGVVSFFAERLEDFEEGWMNSEEVEEDRKERYLRSKAGENVTDYYSDSPELNIVQEDKEAQVLWEKEILFKNRCYTVVNAYACPGTIYAKESYITLRKLIFKGETYIIGKYRLVGVCSMAEEEENHWRRCRAYGNPILKKKYVAKDWYVDENRERHYWSKEHFEEDELETYVWLTLQVGEPKVCEIEDAEEEGYSEEERKALAEEGGKEGEEGFELPEWADFSIPWDFENLENMPESFFRVLFRDIPGEGG